MEGELLPGGWVNDVVRVGGTVVRPRTPNSPFVHALLDLLARAGWSGAPRVLQDDVDGREVLSFLGGTVPWQRPTPSWASSDEALAEVASLVRELHDLTAGTALAGRAEVVCHNDLSPKNTVYRLLGARHLPVALVDWDLAAPGERIDDVAHVCWQWLDLGPAVTDLERARRGVQVVVEAYGLVDRERLVPAVLAWQDRCWRGIEAGAREGDPAMRRLVAAGVPTAVRAAHSWTLAHRRDLAPGRA